MGTLDIADKIAHKIDNLPTLPTIVTALMNTIGDEDHNLRDVVKIVSSDTSLTANILRIANSAAFSRQSDVDSLEKAIVRLGEKLIIGIAIGTSSSVVFDDELEGYQATAGTLWDHSLRTAIASRELAAFAKKKDYLELAFTAGLLHDIGKSVISEYLRGKASLMTKLYDKGLVEDFLEAEREILGTDHSEVGFSIAKVWNIPEPIQVAIRYHHSPSDASEEYRLLVFCVHMGDLITQISGGEGEGADSFLYNLDQSYIDFFGLNRTAFDRIILNVEEEFHAVKQSIEQCGGGTNEP